MNPDTGLALNNILDMLDSLNTATLNAGGIPFTHKKLKTMTAWDLITTLAPNNVRFNHINNKYVSRGGKGI